MKSSFFILLFVQFFFFQSINSQDFQSSTDSLGVWKAGVARAIITPNEYIWMAGYAARTKPADGKLHDLWVKALALEDKLGNRTLLITSDIISFSRDLSESVCNQLKEKYNLERKDIILSSTHTHSGPVVNSYDHDIYPPFTEKQVKQLKNYRVFLEEQIIIVAGRAINSLLPAYVSSGMGIARFATNRRKNKWNEEIPFQPDLKGPSDHAVQVIKVTDIKGIPKAVLFGYSCHATTLSIYKWSGDYPGFAQIELEKHYPGLTAMFFAGFGADQNPLPRGTVSLAVQYGKELSAAVENVMESPMGPLSPSVQTVYKEIELEISPPPDMIRLKDILENGAEWQKRWAQRVIDTLTAGSKMPESYPNYPVQTWQIGNQTLVILGGEVVVDYVFSLRKKFGNELMIMAYANDVMAYIPSERILKGSGYEGESSMWVYGHGGSWVPGIEEKVVNEVVRQVELVRNKELNE
jgi:hypothetical protein